MAGQISVPLFLLYKDGETMITTKINRIISGFPVRPITVGEPALIHESGALLTAQVPQIPFAHDVDERRELPTVGIAAVNSVADGNKMNATTPEYNLRIEAGLEMASPNFAHILYQDMGDLSSLNIGNHLFPCGALTPFWEVMAV